MQHVFWLRTGKIAGRAGPNRYPWVPKQLAEAGINAVLSVNDGESVDADDLAAVGIEHACLPIEDNAPPRPGASERALAVLLRPLALSATAYEPFAIRVLTALEQD